MPGLLKHAISNPEVKPSQITDTWPCKTYRYVYEKRHSGLIFENKHIHHNRLKIIINNCTKDIDMNWLRHMKNISPHTAATKTNLWCTVTY